MKWTLIVLALGTIPVETGLLYDDLDSCYRAEDAMRAEYARWFNAWLAWAQKNPKEAAYPESLDFMKKRVATGVCVPHVGRPNSN
jgi:hypothetical protein